ncbi:S-adenosylmethionine tRNA ribosyltransferase [Salmonella enterica subsp. enterica serovar Mountpleasant]|nr:S-adenosylmethionine tRNA ribosyltransferase [Salmonella enterica subsp. enterica serovar Mountpleasant]
MHVKKLLAHKFDPFPSLPFPAVTLSEFCLFAPAILHTITPRRHKKTGHCDRFVTVSVSVWDEIVAQRISERPRHFRRKTLFTRCR